MFPGNPGPNSLDANVPAILPVGVAVQYLCTDATTYTLFGITSNQCDDQGAFMPAPVCALGKCRFIIVWETFLFVT